MFILAILDKSFSWKLSVLFAQIFFASSLIQLDSGIAAMFGDAIQNRLNNREIEIPPYGMPPVGLRPMAPDALERRPTVIENAGAVPLSISYWNADNPGAWQAVTAAPGAAIPLYCRQCGPAITLALHNGNAVKNLTVPTGAIYTLFWSVQTNSWEIQAASATR